MTGRWLAVLCVACVTLSACVTDAADSDVAGAELADGFTLGVFAEGLVGPTQFEMLDDDRLLIAEIGDEENGEQGRVSVLDLMTRADESGGNARFEATVLVDDLDKPTGVAVFDNRLWVMERNQLSVGSLDGGPLEVVVAEMPFNGRSQGTLTATPDGALLYNTSGRLSGGEPQEGSGLLFSISADGDSSIVASGLKHGYAHTFDAEGQLWVTELSDGEFDGSPAEDELVPVAIGDDLGWPRCVGDNRPVAEFGGDVAACASIPSSLATFGPQATPTSVVVAPWDDSVLVVALWVRGSVVAVDRSGAVTDLASGLDRPQHLVVDGSRVLISEYGTGRILALESEN